MILPNYAVEGTQSFGANIAAMENAKRDQATRMMQEYSRLKQLAVNEGDPDKAQQYNTVANRMVSPHWFNTHDDGTVSFRGTGQYDPGMSSYQANRNRTDFAYQDLNNAGYFTPLHQQKQAGARLPLSQMETAMLGRYAAQQGLNTAMSNGVPLAQAISAIPRDAMGRPAAQNPQQTADLDRYEALKAALQQALTEQARVANSPEGVEWLENRQYGRVNPLGINSNNGGYGSRYAP